MATQNPTAVPSPPQLIDGHLQLQQLQQQQQQIAVNLIPKYANLIK
jgi:hypothetical protein